MRDSRCAYVCEGVGIFEVVKHRDRRDDAKFLASDRPGTEEIADHEFGVCFGFGGEIRGWLKADATNAGPGVGVEKRAVVAADIEHGIAAAKRRKLPRPRGNVRKRGTH